VFSTVIINTDNLLKTRNRLIEEISSLRDEEFNRKNDSITWSIAQVCHHLYLSETVFTKAIRYGLSQDEGFRTEAKNFESVLDRTKKLVAPDIVTPGDGPFEMEEILNLLHQSRSKLESLLSKVEDPTILLEKSTQHPFFGFLPLNQWIDLIYLHEQRHIEQIEEIKVQVRIM
jgi:hypothetical protein